MKVFCSIAILAGSLFISACGENVYIAQKIRFNVDFEEAVTEIQIDLHQDYSLHSNREFNFDILGSLKILDHPDTKASTLVTELHSDPSILLLPWPSTRLDSFPNGKKFPAALHTGELHQWIDENADFGLALLYEIEPDLVIGGRILSDQFKNLPMNFLATQRFFAPNGDTVASISVMGPTKTTKGGLLYLGSFGSNPFLASRSFIELKASEPIRIISKGTSSLPPLFNIHLLLENLAMQIQTFDLH